MALFNVVFLFCTADYSGILYVANSRQLLGKSNIL